MRYTALLGRIIKAAENLKIEGAVERFPEAVNTQILMWKMWLADEYSEIELLKIEAMLMTYLEVR